MRSRRVFRVCSSPTHVAGVANAPENMPVVIGVYNNNMNAFQAGVRDELLRETARQLGVNFA